MNEVSCQIFQTVKNSSSSICPFLYSFAPSTRIWIFLKTKMFFSPFNKRSDFRALKRRFSKTISTPEWRSFEALASRFCVDEFIHHTLLALYFACSLRNAIVSPAFLIWTAGKSDSITLHMNAYYSLFIPLSKTS